MLGEIVHGLRGSAALGTAACWIAALWTAVFGLRGLPRGDANRALAALALGAVFAHVGWVCAHPALWTEGAGWWLDPRCGFSALFVPLGPLLVAAFIPLRRRAEFLGSGLGCLPLALAVARLGCGVAGCCPGIVADGSWAGLETHPFWLYESAALVALHGVVQRVALRCRPARVLIGFGTLRLALEPWRAPGLVAPVPGLSVGFACLWVAIGLIAGRRTLRTHIRPAVPGNGLPCIGSTASCTAPQGARRLSSWDSCSRGSGRPAAGVSAEFCPLRADCPNSRASWRFPSPGLGST